MDIFATDLCLFVDVLSGGEYSQIAQPFKTAAVGYLMK